MKIKINSTTELDQMYNANINQWLRSGYTVTNIQRTALTYFFKVYDEKGIELFTYEFDTF